MKLYLATCDDCPDWQVTARTRLAAETAGAQHASSRHPADLLDDTEAFIRAHESLARLFAHRAGVRPGECYDDVYADALIGLWDAAKRWDPTRAGFSAFAGLRITGAITDGRRQRDPLSRHFRRAGRATPLSLDADLTHDSALTIADLTPDPHDGITEWHEQQEADDRRAALMAAVDQLTPKQRHVIEGQLAGRTLAALGADLGCTESRACQLRHSAIAKLRRVMVAA